MTASSGCHRYDYWNEQALFDGRPDTGWCTPSRDEAQLEFIEIDLGRRCSPALIRLQARPIDGHPGFPLALNLYARVSDQWASVLKVEQITPRAGEWHEWEFVPIDSQWMRIEVNDVEWRAEGKYFLQFMQVELWEGAAG